MARRRGHNEGTFFERKDEDGNIVSYRAQLTLPDGSRRSFSGKTKKEAQRKLDEAKASMLQGRLGPSKNQTIQQYLDSWLATKRLSVKPKTYATYALNVKRVTAHLGRIKLNELTPAQVQDCYNQLSADGLAPLTIRQVHMCFHKALHDAMKLDLIGRNVTESTTLPRITRTEQSWYQLDELDQLFQATTGDRFHALWVLLGTTGLRLGEALGIRWSDVDLPRHKLTVRHALQRQARQGDEAHGKLVFVEPKSKSSLRTIDLSDEACTALRAHQERQTFARRAAGDAWQDYGLVFASRIGTPLEMGRVHKHWNSAVGKAGIPRCRIHDLRHTVASHLMRGGMNVLEVARFLGHSNASLVLEVYGHVAPSTHGKAATLMDALLASQREAAINQ